MNFKRSSYMLVRAIIPRLLVCIVWLLSKYLSNIALVGKHAQIIKLWHLLES